MSRELPSEIGAWTIAFDLYGYATHTGWTETVLPVEDILQITHKVLPRTIDAGCYSGTYVVMMIVDEDWERPAARLEFGDRSALDATINRMVVEYAA